MDELTKLTVFSIGNNNLDSLENVNYIYIKILKYNIINIYIYIIRFNTYIFYFLLFNNIIYFFYLYTFYYVLLIFMMINEIHKKTKNKKTYIFIYIYLMKRYYTLQDLNT